MVRLDPEAAGAAAAAAMSITELRVAFFPLVALDCLGAMAKRESVCVRAGEHVRARSTEEEDEAGTEGTNEIQSLCLYNRKWIR